MKKILSLFTLLFAFFGMAWAQGITVTGIKTIPTDPVNPSTIKTGYYLLKQVNDHQDCAGGRGVGFIKYNSEAASSVVTSVGTETNPNTPNYVWYVEVLENGNIYISTANKVASWQLPSNARDQRNLVAYAQKSELVKVCGVPDRLNADPVAPKENSCYITNTQKDTYFHFKQNNLGSWTSCGSNSTFMVQFFPLAITQLETTPFLVSEAPANGQWAENTTWYNLKINGTKWISVDPAYCDNQGNIKLMNTEKPNNDAGLWCFVLNEDGTFTVYNKSNVTTNVLGFTNGNGNGGNDRAKMHANNEQNVFTKFEFKQQDATHGYFAFRVGNKYHILEDRGDGAGTQWFASWIADAFNGSNARKVEFVAHTTNKRLALRYKIDDAETNWLPYEGIGPNKYTAVGKTQTLEQVLTDAELLYNTEGTTDEEYQAAIDEIDATVQAMTINQPENGKFYRLRCTQGNKYILPTIKDNCLETKNEKQNAALFYCQNVETNKKTFLAFNNGQYFGKTENNKFAYIAVGTTSGKDFLFTEGGQKGCYKVQQGGRYIYGASDKMDAGSNPNSNGYYWWLEEVTTLPVTVSAAGWATLYAPVALTIPTGLTGVYTAAVDGNTLKLTALNDEIPANTPVLIEAAEGKYNFNINYNAAAQTAQAVGKGLSGTLETINKPADKTIYTLQKPAAANNEIGFYKYGGENLQGFRAYGENLLGTTSTAEGLIFDKGDVTAIENVEINDGKQTVIYDLSGRRVEKMLKGIYIVNGKKVIK